MLIPPCSSQGPTSATPRLTTTTPIPTASPMFTDARREMLMLMPLLMLILCSTTPTPMLLIPPMPTPTSIRMQAAEITWELWYLVPKPESPEDKPNTVHFDKSAQIKQTCTQVFCNID